MSVSTKYHVGLPQWNHSAWQDSVLAGSKHGHPLKHYARYFNSVEGNTTFYGLPNARNVETWNIESPDDFNFCFKLPQTITHQSALKHCESELKTFFSTMEPLQEKIGLISIQLPASFAPSQLDVLTTFFKQLPKDWPFAIEVRHIGFFDKNESERRFNRLLLDFGINRTMFDTRTLFANPESDDATQDALQKKPNLPLHVIATAERPMMRFISPLNWQLAKESLTPWLAKTESWIKEGKTPYLFFHTPDNHEAPELARYFCQQLSNRASGLNNPLDWQSTQKEQTDLF